MNILPYVIDWFFVLILGILMAVLSFIIDFFIEQIRRGEGLAWGEQISKVTHVVGRLRGNYRVALGLLVETMFDGVSLSR